MNQGPLAPQATALTARPGSFCLKTKDHHLFPSALRPDNVTMACLLHLFQQLDLNPGRLGTEAKHNHCAVQLSRPRIEQASNMLYHLSASTQRYLFASNSLRVNHVCLTDGTARIVFLSPYAAALNPLQQSCTNTRPFERCSTDWATMPQQHKNKGSKRLSEIFFPFFPQSG